MNAGDFPVTGGAVLTGRCRSHTTPRARGIAALRQPFERLDIAEPKSFQPRQLQSTTGAGEIAQRVAALIAVTIGVGRLTDPDAVKDYDRRTSQLYAPV